ncbi:hypothetical protein ANCDUO_00147 [Ancylostoma duodenale]|uniref:Uncharacterized protein n=1 Tax=Ancylostoma duodenale TaxID=51022 RepID=A0A0C2DHR4_9BILA|nr:hypothetical protein ANCDUO_00147 [Ancylostoma duodenale]
MNKSGFSSIRGRTWSSSMEMCPFRPPRMLASSAAQCENQQDTPGSRGRSWRDDARADDENCWLASHRRG